MPVNIFTDKNTLFEPWSTAPALVFLLDNNVQQVSPRMNASCNCIFEFTRPHLIKTIGLCCRRSGLNSRQSLIGNQPQGDQVEIRMEGGHALDLDDEIEDLHSSVRRLKHVSKSIQEETSITQQILETLVRFPAQLPRHMMLRFEVSSHH